MRPNWVQNYNDMAKKNDIAKAETASIQPVEQIESLIITVRGKQVILDRDLAHLYGVETRVLNQAVQRNIERFPEDFMFKLTKEEFDNLRSQIVTSNEEVLRSQNVTIEKEEKDLTSQIVISNKRGGQRYVSYAFTENGIAMLSSVLRSPMAIATNIHIMRAFNAMRHFPGFSHCEPGRTLAWQSASPGGQSSLDVVHVRRGQGRDGLPRRCAPRNDRMGTLAALLPHSPLKAESMAIQRKTQFRTGL